MKKILLSLTLSIGLISFMPNYAISNSLGSETSLKQKERKLSEEEVKQRGIDILVAELTENIDEVDLRKMARSAIFETSYGFRWKMYNVQSGKIIVIKVNENFELISVREGEKSL